MKIDAFLLRYVVLTRGFFTTVFRSYKNVYLFFFVICSFLFKNKKIRIVLIRGRQKHEAIPLKIFVENNAHFFDVCTIFVPVPEAGRLNDFFKPDISQIDEIFLTAINLTEIKLILIIFRIISKKAPL